MASKSVGRMTVWPSMKPPRLPVASKISSSLSAICAVEPAMVCCQEVAKRAPCSKNSARLICVSAPSSWISSWTKPAGEACEATMAS